MELYIRLPIRSTPTWGSENRAVMFTAKWRVKLAEPRVQDVFSVGNLVLTLLSRQDQLDLEVNSLTRWSTEAKSLLLRAGSSPTSWPFPSAVTVSLRHMGRTTLSDRRLGERLSSVFDYDRSVATASGVMGEVTVKTVEGEGEVEHLRWISLCVSGPACTVYQYRITWIQKVGPSSSQCPLRRRR
jgi:hypothetical protein